MQPATTIRERLQFLISRISLIFFGMLLALVTAEIVLRLFPIPNRFILTQLLEQQWQSDDELLMHLKPNLDMRIYGHPEFSYTVHTNADGLRDEPFVGTFDIAAIGDSYTFGFGVEEPNCWPTRLEAISGARVANLGWAGWNSHVYPDTIRRYAIPLHTHIWLWAFFVNDLPESAGAEEFLASGQTDFKEWAMKNQTPAPDLSFLHNIRVLQLLATLINPDLLLLPDSGDRVFDNGELRIRYGLYAWKVTDPTRPEVRRGWELTEAALLETQQLAFTHEATLVVIFIPNRAHVYWPYIQNMMKDVDVQQLDDVEARLADFCESHDIIYLNLLPDFRSQALSGKMLYFSDDGHWNEEGHDLAARLIYDMLLRKELHSK